MSPSFLPSGGEATESSAGAAATPVPGSRGGLVLAALSAAEAAECSVVALKVHNRL